MSEEGTEQDRSERPTPYKLQRARRRGAVARGVDLGFLTGLAAFTAWAWLQGSGFAGRVGQGVRADLVTATTVADGAGPLMAVGGQLLVSAVRPLALLLGAVFLVVLVFEVLQVGGVVFSAEPLRMDFNRLNPAQGLKRLFSFKLLIEAGKNVLKLVVYGGLAWLAVRAALESAGAIADASGLLLAFQAHGLKLLAAFVGAAAVFAALDQLIARRDFLKRMRMSRREIKRESRDREGDPRLKQRRKQLHREFVKLSQSLRGIRGADILVTNPTHFAVALRYDPARMDAPQVVARGAHQVALRLKRLAFLYGVTTVRNPPLARALFRCELDRPVPEALYQPIADLYRALRREGAAETQD